MLLGWLWIMPSSSLWKRCLDFQSFQCFIFCGQFIGVSDLVKLISMNHTFVSDPNSRLWDQKFCLAKLTFIWVNVVDRNLTGSPSRASSPSPSSSSSSTAFAASSFFLHHFQVNVVWNKEKMVYIGPKCLMFPEKRWKIRCEMQNVYI